MSLCLSLKNSWWPTRWGTHVAALPTGMPTEKQTYHDIEAVYKALTATYPPEKIIVYGQSVGSGPSCWLASRYTVHSLILHSPIMSGLRVITTSRALCCCDIFPNIDRVRKVHCPVLLLHGNHDEEVRTAVAVTIILLGLGWLTLACVLLPRSTSITLASCTARSRSSTGETPGSETTPATTTFMHASVTST